MTECDKLAVSGIALIVFIGVASIYAILKVGKPKQRSTERIPCPVRWPDCSPDGCSKCDGKGYTEELRH